MEKKGPKVDPNNDQNKNDNQAQQINDLSRFGHSVTLCKKNIFKKK